MNAQAILKQFQPGNRHQQRPSSAPIPCCRVRGQNNVRANLPPKLAAGRASDSLVMTTASPLEGAGGTAENFKGEVLDPSIFNKNWVRLAAVSVAIAASARSTGYLPTKVAAFVHLLGFAINFGMIFWVTFIAGLVMFKNMGRQSFGKLQAKLFPKYFLLSIFTIALQLGTLKFALPTGLLREQQTSLGIALLASIANFIAEPLGTKVLFERYELEKSGGADKEKIKSLKAKFGAFHGLSSILNLVVLVASASHGYWLSSRIAL